MILCSLKCHHFPRHSIICMAISVIGTLKFWGHPLLSEPTKNKPVNWHFARPGWYQVRMTINITGNLTLTLLEPSLKWKNKFKTLWPWIRNKKIKTNCVSLLTWKCFMIIGIKGKMNQWWYFIKIVKSTSSTFNITCIWTMLIGHLRIISLASLIPPAGREWKDRNCKYPIISFQMSANNIIIKLYYPR